MLALATPAVCLLVPPPRLVGLLGVKSPTVTPWVPVPVLVTSFLGHSLGGHGAGVASKAQRWRGLQDSGFKHLFMSNLCAA